MLRGKDVIIREILKHIVDSGLMLNSIMTTTYLRYEKVNQAKSALSGVRRIIQEANSVIVYKRIAKSRQMTLHDFGMKKRKT